MIVQTSPTLPRCHSPSSCVSPLGLYHILLLSDKKVEKVSKRDGGNSENVDDAATKPLWLY